MSGENIKTSNYVLESFGSTIDPINPDQQINSLKDLVTNYSSELASALENNFMGELSQRIFYSAKNFISKSWDIGTSDTISEIKLIANYATSETNHAVKVASIKLKTPINVKNINKENIDTIWANNVSGSTYAGDYVFGYNPSVQGTRDDLVNAIFAANGIEEKEGATRLFVDGGSRVDDKLKGSSHEFKVAEITENGITEFTILVKEANNDSGYIKNLQSNSDYRVTNEKSCSYSSNQVKK